MTFAELVREEVTKARSKHAPIHSLHEGYAVLLEEVDELWDEVKKRAAFRDQRNVLLELVQIGAMAQRVAEDTRLLEPKRTDFVPQSGEDYGSWGLAFPVPPGAHD